MSRISGATAQQSVSSSTMTMEEPAVSKKEVKTESKTETPSHSEAQKQNAVSRQGDNNLTAMLQKERLAETPRGGIKKEDLDSIAKALTSKPTSPNEAPAAEGVKEELARTFINNGPGQHAKIAECMRQFAASGSNTYGQAYQAMKKEAREWTKFDPTGQTQPAQRNFFKEVAQLRGPGSERVKADVALMIQGNIEAAEKSKVPGHLGYAGMYTHELTKMLQSDAPNIFRTLENEPGVRREVAGMMDNLLNHRDGQRAIGEMVADLTLFTTKQLMRSPHDARHAARAYGYFMDHVKEGIDRNAQTREAAIEQGANILGVGLKMIEKLVPKEAHGVF